MIHILLIFFTLFFFHSTECEQYTFSSAKQVYELDQAEIPSFRLGGVSFDSDVALSQKEFDYLTQLRIGSQITPQALQEAVSTLFKKNVWSEIALSLQHKSDETKVHFTLKGYWRFDGIKVKGFWGGKEWYKPFYVMEPGDQFEQQKHDHAVERMKEACKKDGFFNVRAYSTTDRNPHTKGVFVTTTLLRGKRFAIRKNTVCLKADRILSKDQRHALQHQIERKLARQLLNAKYAKSLLNSQAKELKEFLVQKGFMQVAITLKERVHNDQRAVHLEWHIDISKKREFVFFGNSFYPSKKLLETVLQFGRSSFIVPASILAQEIQKAYQQKGFWNVSIEAKDEGERSIFVIKEGQRAIVETIFMFGVRAASEQKLIKRHFCKVLKNKVYDAELTQQALDQLADAYQKDGFLESKIVHHDLVKRQAGEGYALHITVHEGERTTIGSVTIPGFQSLEKNSLFQLPSKAPISFDAALIQKQKRFLSEHMHKEGYLFATITHELRPTDTTHELVWNIETGDKITFGKTIVQSQTTLPFESIARELSYSKGEQWDAQKIQKSFARLKSLHVFESISFTPLPLLPGSTTRDVLLKIRQDDPFELRVRAGLELQNVRQYQTFAGVAYRIGGTFMVKNITNHADLFRFDADVAKAHREVHMKYLYPWVFATPFDGIVDGYAMKYEQPGFIGSKRTLYTLYQNGFLGGIRYKREHVDCAFNCGFEVARTSFKEDDLNSRASAIRLAQAINFDIALLNRRVAYLYFEPTILIDFLDHSLYPTRGSLTLLSCKGMFPTSQRYIDACFFKLLLEHSWFVPLGSWVGAFRLRCGHIFHTAFNQIMPNERFYLGGSNSIRSYLTDLAPPTSLFIDDCDECHIVPRGGKSMVNANIELRIPLFNRVGLVVFQDIGALSSDGFADFKPEHAAAGTGFGVRFATPVGPLRFDVGWKWRVERPDERNFNWVLTFGNAF